MNTIKYTSLLLCYIKKDKLNKINLIAVNYFIISIIASRSRSNKTKNHFDCLWIYKTVKKNVNRNVVSVFML